MKKAGGERGRDEKALIALDSMFYIPGKLCNVKLPYKAISISSFLVYYEDNFVLKYCSKRVAMPLSSGSLFKGVKKGYSFAKTMPWLNFKNKNSFIP